MANDLQNTSNVSTNVTGKAGLVTDLNSSLVSQEQYSHARNAVRNSKEGDLGTIGNEPSNLHCWNATHKIVGMIPLPGDDILVLSGNGTSSEIGIGNETTCSYRILSSLDCWQFSPDFPITGVAKQDFQRGIVVTFTDKFNPVRRIELKNIEDVTDCDDTLLFKKINQPCITVKKGQLGNMPNGTYSVALAYVVDNQVFSDWYAITNRVTLFSESGSNSLEVKISGLDTEFDQFALLVIGNYVDPVTKGVTKLAKQVGIYSTKVTSISITDFINTTFEEVQISNLLLQRKTWQQVGIISANANYLIMADLVARPEEDYQLKAMGIEPEYVIEQVPASYYENDGRDVGYYRDENYDFYIQGVYTTGEFTDKFHIPGPRPTAHDLSSVSSADVYELDAQFADCEPKAKIPRWQVENTAEKPTPYNNEFSCGRRIYGRGRPGVWLSTERYPDNEATFGEDANTFIRYSKAPDECKMPRYSIIDGVTYVNIIGWRFKNIPKFDNPDIVGYKITRSDRKGGNGTVIARGLMTNTRSYHDTTFDQDVYYANYPVNDLSPDQFISSTQTAFRNNRETNFTPLTDYFKDKFNFYSPHTLFEPRYSLGDEIKIESVEVADVVGQFEQVFNHPRQKLMNQFSFWLSAAVGFIESALILIGRQTSTATRTTNTTNLVHVGVVTATTGLPIANFNNSVSQEFRINTVGDLVGLNIPLYIQKNIAAGNLSALSIIGSVLTLLAALAIKIPYSILGGIKAADDTMEIIRQLTGYTDYVYQYNAIATFNRSICMPEGQKRRRLIQDATYLPSTVVSVDSKIFNNLFRERSVFVQLNKEISEPTVEDNTRQTARGFGLCGDITQKARSTGSAYYATSKAINPNQYGALGSSSPVSMHSCVLPFSDSTEPTVLTESPILYGGDCVITRFTFQKRMQFFSQNLAGTDPITNARFPDGVEYDYRKYRNIGYPRFWIDSTKYDFSELLSGNRVNFTRFSRTTTSKHNLDCKEGDTRNIVRIDDAYMYLSNNAGIDFFVEADYNVDFREKQLNDQPYFSKKDRDVNNIFRSDRLAFEEEFNISRAFSDIQTTEIFAPIQRPDFDPTDPLPVNQPNSVIYSLPSFNLQEVDNWQYILPANYFAFRESDFGTLTGIHKVDQDRLIFLFSKSSPYISMGRDFLELEGSGRKVTIGDGGLFAQDPREIMPTDNNYGACNSRYAFSNTHLGRYYPSERQGRILNFTESLDDITRQGISYWCKNYMPIALYNYFPTYPRVENPLNGVGYLSVFDSYSETVYITKRDFSPNRELVSEIIYDDEEKVFRYRGDIISLRDPRFFNDISWTLSYSPLDKGFVSWHDWHPDWVVQRDNHFLTVKDNGVWKHNERFDSFCNFYGVDYPFEIEFVSNGGQNIEIARSLEYILETYHYKNFGRDRFHLHHENFSHLIVHNTEQMSPLLGLNYMTSNPEINLGYPQKDPVNGVSWKILYSKEENKYRINQFWDAVKDRGEFTNAEVHLFPTDESGYKQVINPVAIDVDKPEEQRKKFRHYYTKFRLIKAISGASKFLTKLYNIKKVLSIR
jgi:hypothetical protein